MLKHKVAKEEEFDIEGQMNGGEGNDVVLEIEEENNEGKLVLSKDDSSLSRTLIDRFVSFISEANTTHDLVDVASKSFEFTLKLANSVQSPAIVKTILQISSTIFTKIREISAFSEDSSAEGTQLFAKIVKSLVGNFSAIEGASQDATYKLSPLGAKTLLSLSESFLASKAYKAQYNNEIARVLVSITSFINDDKTIFVKKVSEVFNLIKSLHGYD